MTSIPDTRRLRIHQIAIADGELTSSSAADARQTNDGDVEVSGLWSGIIPLMPEDMNIRAKSVGVSPLEWFRLRLLSSVMIEVEVIDAT
jgi:hypothetical protein